MMITINFQRLITKKDTSSIIDNFSALSDTPFAIIDAESNLIRGTLEERGARRYPVELNGEVLGWIAGDETACVLAGVISFAAKKEFEQESLSRETLHRYRELSNLYDFSERVTLSLASPEIATIAIHQLLKSVHATGAAVLLCNGTQGLPQIAAAYGEESHVAAFADGKDNMADVILNTDKGEIINDPSSDPRFSNRHSEVHALMYAPLICKGRTLGLLSVSSKNPHSYRAEDLKILSSIASQTAIAVNNAQLYAQLCADAEEREKKNAQLQEEINQRIQMQNALMASKEKYRLHFEHAADVIYSVDEDFRIMYISPSVTRHLGYLPEELTGKPYSELSLLTDESLARALSDTLRIFAGEVIESAEYEIVAKDGTIKSAEVRSVPIRKDGKVTSIVSVARDITIQRKAEHALAASENRFRTMAENITNGLIIMEEGRMVYANDRACQLCGYSRDELINLWGPDLTAPQSVDEKDQILREIRETGVYPEQVDTWITRKDGTQCCLNLRFSFAYSGDKKHTGYVIITDITEHRRADDEIHATKHFLDDIIENSIDAIVIAKPGGFFTRVNRAFLALSGYTEEEVLGKRIAEFSVVIGKEYESVTGERIKMDDEYMNYTVRMAEQLMIEKKASNWKSYLERKDGKAVPVEMNITYLFDVQGAVTGAVGMLRDITERIQSEREIREARDFLDNIIQSSHDPIILADTMGYITRVNRAFLRFTGYDQEELIGRHSAELVPPGPGCYESSAGDEIVIDEEYYKKSRDIIARFMEVGHVAGWETFYFSKDRKVIPVEQTIFYLHDKYGQRVAVVGMIRDITERKKSEEEIRKTSDFLDNIIENSLDPIVIGDRLGNITRVNKAFVKLVGFNQEELTGKHLAELVPPRAGCYESTDGAAIMVDESFYDRAYEQMGTLIEKGYLSAWESFYFNKDGAVVPVEQTMFYLYDKTGNRIGVVTINRDISERKKAEQKLIETRNFLSDIIRTSADGIVVTDTLGNITVVNDAVERIVGYSQEYFMGKNIHDFMIMPDGSLRNDYAESPSKGTDSVFFFESKWRAHGGREIDLAMSVSALKDFKGNTNGMVACIRDITDHKAAERKLYEYQNQLRCLASQLTLTEEQERKHIASEIHDRIAQSLALAKIKLGALGAAVTTGEKENDIAVIRSLLDQSIKDTRALIFDLSPPFLYEFGLEKALEWLLEDMEKKHGLTTHLTCNGTAGTYDDDVRILLYQSIRELLINIVKHANAKSATVSLDRNAHMVHVCVEDDGRGFAISPDGFHVTSQGGYGIFSIQERFQHLGGSLKIESRLHHGTRIALELPLVQQRAQMGGAL